MRLHRTTLGLVTLLAAAAGMLPIAAQTQWTVARTFHVGGEGAWDYVTVDAHHQRFFVTRGAHTQAIDENSGKVLGDIPGQIRSHGVALVPKLNRGFLTDGGGKGAILVFDSNTYKVLGSIPTMPDSDGIIYDPYSNLVLAVSGDGSALMTIPPDIDPKNGKIPPPIALDGEPEFLAVDASGRVYINIPDKNLVEVVDLKSRRIVDRWPVAPGGQPVGMAIDAAHHRLFIGCRKPQMLVVMSTETGKVEAALPIGAGNDAVRYSNGQGFASCRDGSLTVIGEKNGKWDIEQSLKTADGARTLGLDPFTRRVFLPTAQMEPAAPGKRPQMKPGSFEIVVVEGK